MKHNFIDVSQFRRDVVVKSHRIRKGNYHIYGYFVRDIGDCYRVHFALPRPYCPFIRRDSPYWVKWIDTIRSTVYVVPAIICTIGGAEVTFDEFYHSFVSPCLI